MDSKLNFLLPIYLIFIIAVFTSCINSTNSEEDISDSLDPVEDVTAITGAENSSIIVNRGSDSYFVIQFSQIQNNEIIENGYEGEGWCIDWQVAIDSDNGTYDNIQLYSTFNVEKWNPLNYFFNIVDDLKSADPELTYREFQVVIWSLRGFPEFNLEAIPNENLPSRMRTNGEINFSRDKVNTILEIVEGGYEDFEFVEGTRFAVIAETPSDVQTVITVVE
ncbi:hypothetical protein [Rhodohalobacter sp.]|uniref:hypothetical protein n=1 Tax=Rhodohalobacter sp. TaxID=1974210 RepID=UPI002ACE4ED3|nr:hypothetical protein [Rhodohalobacter sp.]MDZ7757199.1 hypothetical protein [Rhodohalobacter sp.]